MERLPTPVFWPGEFHGLYSPWGCKELDTTEWLLLYLTAMILHVDEAPLSCARHYSGCFIHITANPYTNPPRFKFYHLHIQLRKLKVRETLCPQGRPFPLQQWQLTGCPNCSHGAPYKKILLVDITYASHSLESRILGTVDYAFNSWPVWLHASALTFV